MNFSVNLLRRGALGAALAAAMLLASCGGGDPVVEFVPTRVLAFGDEDSIITSDGRKYTVNAFKDDGAGGKVLDCSANSIWVQRLAAGYGLVFPECNSNNTTDPPSRIYAAANAKVADLAAQIDQHLATDTFSGKDLVTLMVGQHDVLEQYERYPDTSQAELLQAVFDAGKVLAAQVSRVAAAGGKVLVSTVPELGVTPFAVKENAASGDSTRSALLTQLVAKFNEGLRVGIQNETGDKVALMLTDELVQSMAKFPGSYGGMTNVTSAVCDPAKAATVDLCTSDTLVTDGSALLYLWADDLHLSPNGHAYVGSLASSRARANPF